MPLNSERQFRQAAATGNVNKIKNLISSNPNLNLNASGPESGRTAVHWAAVKGHEQVLILLKQLGADLNRSDKAGFTPIELSINPIEFSGTTSSQLLDERFKQIKNLQEYFQANNCPIFYVRNISEMEKHITQNLYLNKIGFIIDTPNILKATTESMHVLPIFFERKAAIERFIILDSAYVNFIPLKIKKKIRREIIFNPFIRQASGNGCFREAIFALIHCFFDKNLSDFCLINSKSINISVSPTKDECKMLEDKPKTTDEMLSTANIQARLNFKKMQSISIETNSMVTDVRCLKTLPKWMFFYIEHYGLLRTLKNTPEGHCALKKISINPNLLLYPRNKEIAYEELVKNLFLLDKKYDFNTYKFKEFSNLPITKQNIEEALNITETLNMDIGKDSTLLRKSFGKFSLFHQPPSEAPSKDSDQKNSVNEVMKIK